MSWRRKLGIVLGVTSVALAVALAVGIGWLYLTLRPLGEALEHGLLGPPDQRQRVEVADRRFAISFAEDWLVEMEPQQPATDESQVVLLLVVGPPGGVPSCQVGLVRDGRSFEAESFLLAWAADRAPHGEVSASTPPGSAEGVIGIGLSEADGFLAAAYWVPLAEDALIISCMVDQAADRPPDDDGLFTSDARALVLWGMPPIVASVEPLPRASPGTDDHVGRPGSAARDHRWSRD